ncbi:DUF4145 domain-containing protein [Pedobacter sp. UYP1]|uniref:DUF4145 domain-containing protein n=1 Tax=Pedobacter sp. UYP1 TaxID=1756396 RepID=UPI00339378F9
MDEIIKIFCYNCQCETKQKILFDKHEVMIPEIFGYDKEGNRGQSVWTVEFMLWKISECQGCEKTNFNVIRRFDPKQTDILMHQFPKKQIRDMPHWVSYLNVRYMELFIEIYSSFNSGHVRLPLMGARTLLDMFMVEKIGDIGPFQRKLKKLAEDKFISDSAIELLEIALEYGHAAIHRGYQAEKEEIMGVLDIIENLFQSEALKHKSKNLKRTIPKDDKK